MTVRSNLMASFTLVIVLLLAVVGTVAYTGTRTVIERQVSEATVAALIQTDKNLAAVLGGASDLSLFLIANRNVRQLLTSPQVSGSAQPDLLPTLNEDLSNLAGSKAAILSINIYGDNGLQYETAGPSTVLGEALPWPSLVPSDGTSVLTLPYRRNFQTLGTRYVLSFCRQLNDMNHLSQRLGLVRIDIDEQAVAALYRQSALGKTGTIFVTDGKGRILSHADPELLGRPLSGDPLYASAIASQRDGYRRVKSAGVDLLVASHRSALQNLVFVSSVPFAELTIDADRAGLLLLAALFVALGLGAWATWLVALRITGPIHTLIATMREVEEGDLEVEVDVRSNSELGSLGRSFNRMTARLRTLIDEVYTSQIVRKEAELKALQAQINPHFLYNTLGVIYWTAKVEHAPKTAEVVQALARLFKLGLNQGNEMTTVARELEHLENYLVIQRVRFEVPPEVSIDVDADLLGCLTPKLVLQPLVENAFVHALAGLDRPGSIRIAGRLVPRDATALMVFTVEDNGVGMEAQRVSQVLSGVAASETYGLKNVNEVIRLTFGAEYGLAIESTPGSGTKVTVRMPATSSQAGPA
jgi:two-component system sensor histidine kinase YesM